MDKKDILPLTETTYLIMLSLAQRPMHDYAIIKKVREISKSRIVLSTGTLYGAIKRLLDIGWIERVSEDFIKDDLKTNTKRSRKAYKLTHLGRKSLKGEVIRIQQLLSAANLHLEGREI